MKYNIRLIIKYWSKHIRIMLSFITIFTILIAYTFISFSMVRTELRRVYADCIYTNGDGTGYHSLGNGNYSQIMYNVKTADIPQLKDKTRISEYESVFINGYIGTEGYSYTSGGFTNENAERMGGYKFINGGFPQKSGEIAVSELALENMGITASVGDVISLNTYNPDREKTGQLNLTVSGIFRDNGTNDNWDTNGKSINRYFSPVMILHISDIDTEAARQHIMFNWAKSDEERYFMTEEESNAELDFFTKCLEASGCSAYGNGAVDSRYFLQGAGDSSDGFIKSTKSYFYQYTGIGAAVLMAITMFCGLFVVIPERVKSFRLLWQVGCPIRRIRCMFIAEWLMFTVLGIVSGIVVSVIGYELLLQLQHTAFGLDIYRAYGCEWGIKQITFSPLMFAIIAACISSFAAYIIPCIRLNNLVTAKPKKSIHGRIFAPKSLTGFVHKIFDSGKITALQIVSLVLVVSLSCSAFMFFSLSGKENNSNPQIIEQGKFFMTDLEVDRKELAIDLTIEDTYKTFNAGLLDLDISSGYSPESEKIISDSGLFSTCYAFAELRMFAAYPQDTTTPAALKPHTDFVEGEQEWYGLSDRNVYQLGTPVIVNDNMLKDIISDSRYGENSIYVVAVKSSPFKKGDIIPLFSANGEFDLNAPFRYNILNKCNFNAEVADVISVKNLSENKLLSGVLKKLTEDYLIVIPQSTAKAVNLSRQNFEQFYAKYNDGTTDDMAKSLIRSVNIPEAYMYASTMTECEKHYYETMMKEYVIVFAVFGLLFLLSMIGYSRTIKLQIIQKEKQLKIMRSLGMSQKSARKCLFRELMRTPVIACVVSAFSVIGIKALLYSRYIMTEDIRDKMALITNSSSDEYITLWTELIKIQQAFFTEYEMWKVPVLWLWIVLVLLILVCIGAIVWRNADKILKKLD